MPSHIVSSVERGRETERERDGPVLVDDEGTAAVALDVAVFSGFDVGSAILRWSEVRVKVVRRETKLARTKRKRGGKSTSLPEKH